ncbi:hypothetical protein C8T65DRAFT_672976 [Cerioporus squamosus]|nr:hypothetical protein C8T65DRAFT_672976 [Cerioporus squamosus]
MPPRKKSRKRTAQRNEAARSNPIDATKADGRTQLGGLPKMPLDILVEIFSLLHPRDLVNLARTARDFRAFLMSRDSAPFWRAARKQVDGLPDCPPFLSEPAYANLVFSTHCHGCAISDGSNIAVWEFAARYCAQCQSEQLVSTTSARVLVSQIQDNIRDPVLLATHISSTRYPGDYYHRPDFDRLKAVWDGGFSSDMERIQFCECARRDVRLRREFSTSISRWVEEEDARKYAELKLLREGRINEYVSSLEHVLEHSFYLRVEQRLRDEGWGRELDWRDGAALGHIKTMQSVRKAEKLSDRAWTTIRKDAIKVLEKHRNYRLCAERVEELQPRLALLSSLFEQWERAQNPRTADTDWHPTFADLALMPPFRDCIDVSAETAFEDDTLLKMQILFPELVATWREERKADFLKMITDALGSVPDDVDPLSLAVATLDCTRCSYKSMRWPQFLAHQCARRRQFLFFMTDDTRTLYGQAVLAACNRLSRSYMWDSKAFVFNPSLDRTRSAIEACGKDPNTVTYEDMESCDVRVVCSECRRHCQVLDWKMAARQETSCSGSFQVLNAEDTAKALELEAFQLSLAVQTRLEDTSLVYGCRRCRYRGDLSDIGKHCSSNHGIRAVRIDVDYYLHTDIRPCMPTPIRIYPQGRRALTTMSAIQALAAFVSSSI